MPDDFNIQEILAAFVYSGNKLKLDIDLVQWRLLNQGNALIDELLYEKTKMLRDGITERVADNQIKQWIRDGEGPVRTWFNTQDRIIRELTNHLVQRPVMEFENKNPGLIYAWELGEVKTQHCSDCLRLSKMEPRTIDQWRDLGHGLPREGRTDCSYGCRCMLEVVGQVEQKAEKPDKFVPAKTVKEAEEWFRKNGVTELNIKKM